MFEIYIYTEIWQKLMPFPFSALLFLVYCSIKNGDYAKYLFFVFT